MGVDGGQVGSSCWFEGVFLKGQVGSMGQAVPMGSSGHQSRGCLHTQPASLRSN